MLKNEIHYFLSTVGSRGYRSFEDECFGSLVKSKRLFGYPAALVQQVVDRIKREAAKREFSCQVIHNFLDGKAEGIIIEETKAGIINTPLYFLKREHFAAVLEDEHIERTKKALDEAVSCFREAKKIHDKWEKIYVLNMDFGAADSLADEVCRKVINGKKGSGEGAIYDRFLGAATAEGPRDMIESITEKVGKRYFIKGRPGTGKSTFLRKIIRAAQENGFDVERYHCAFDPGSVDMAVIRGMGVCFFDSTAPHEHFPMRSGDEIIDIYDAAITPGTDEKYEKELLTISGAYKLKMLEAQKALFKARSAYEKTEAFYMAKTNHAELEMLTEECLALLFDK